MPEAANWQKGSCLDSLCGLVKTVSLAVLRRLRAGGYATSSASRRMAARLRSTSCAAVAQDDTLMRMAV